MTPQQKIEHLIVEIEAEIQHFQQLRNDVTEVRTRFIAKDKISPHDIRGISMLLTEIYVGAENLMLRIAKNLAEPIPSGKAWHKELLDQFSVEAPRTRPALYSLKTVENLDEFRRFRHVVHHVYSYQYDWPQVRKLLSKSEKLLVGLIADAQAFTKVLVQIISDEE